MKQVTFFILVSALFISCNNDSSPTRAEEAKHTPLEGTWQLISGTTITKDDTVTTDYTKSQKMIKIINATHFAFLLHDITKGKDTAIYSSGGGTYTLSKDQYTEHLDYCNDRNWEGHSFPFTVSIKDDTLIQTGIEKVESAGVDRMNIEKYKRIKN
ncbi:MAG: lipocalin family protein [Bacteroidetes bacterium]|nr:MAG: lipocalin family protein [Bacteroidota bacterium]